MRSSHPKRKFCMDTFRLTIRESRAHDVYPTIDDVTAPYESLYIIVSVIVEFRNLSVVPDFAIVTSQWYDYEQILFPGARPTNGISIELEIQSKFWVL